MLETLELQKPLVINPTSLVNKGEPVKKEQDVVLPVLVFSCNRPDIRRSLDGLLKYRPDAKKFPIIVSQDCAHGATAEVIRSYSSQVTYIQVEFVNLYNIMSNVSYDWFFKQQPDQTEPVVPSGEYKFRGYFKIARHYLWGLSQVFRTFNHSAVIIVEGIHFDY